MKQIRFVAASRVSNTVKAEYFKYNPVDPNKQSSKKFKPDAEYISGEVDLIMKALKAVISREYKKTLKLTQELTRLRTQISRQIENLRPPNLKAKEETPSTVQSIIAEGIYAE